jgi:hypothetical protein
MMKTRVTITGFDGALARLESIGTDTGDAIDALEMSYHHIDGADGPARVQYLWSSAGPLGYLVGTVRFSARGLFVVSTMTYAGDE